MISAVLHASLMPLFSTAVQAFLNQVITGLLHIFMAFGEILESLVDILPSDYKFVSVFTFPH